MNAALCRPKHYGSDNAFATLDNSLNNYMIGKRSERTVDINQSHNPMLFTFTQNSG